MSLRHVGSPGPPAAPRRDTTENSRAALSDGGGVTPLYHKMFLIMRQRIEGGVYDNGVVPGEMDLAREFGVSRITAARALNDLAALGLVDRKRGRGTRVVPPPQQTGKAAASIEGLIENLVQMGLRTQVRVLSFDYVVPPDDVRRELRLDAGVRAQRVVRVRSRSGAPFSYLTTWVPEPIGLTFGRDDLGATPMLTLIERAGVKVASATQIFSAAIADPQIAEALQTEVGAALLTIQRTVIAENGDPVQHIRAAYRPDRYRYRLALTREAGEFGNLWADAGSAPA